jgi:hypothetical protein
VELKFLAETEFGHFDEVDDAAVKVFEHFVGYGQSLQLVVDQREFVFWSEYF